MRSVRRNWVLLAMLLVGVQVLWVRSAAQVIDPSWVAPAQAEKRPNPMREKPNAGLGGGKIFQRSCVMCHGDTTHERTNHAPDLSSPAVQSETDGTLFWRVSQGNSRRAMPSFSNIPEAQRWQLVLYIRSLSKEERGVAK
jgi:mono/diheme cytochrome c family protein